ncbi:hypothetical protein BD560DRAFT_423919 [Blakeslea trispora]|nr:hypothetical protein BD560DRAFT_423919 [Blakeslea trispora]
MIDKEESVLSNGICFLFFCLSFHMLAICAQKCSNVTVTQQSPKLPLETNGKRNYDSLIQTERLILLTPNVDCLDMIELEEAKRFNLDAKLYMLFCAVWLTQSKREKNLTSISKRKQQ